MKTFLLRVCFSALVITTATAAWGGQDDHLTLAVGADNLPATAKAADSASDKEPIQICRELAPVTGTRLGGRRVCRTQAEWDAVRENAKRSVDNIQSKGDQVNVPH